MTVIKADWLQKPATTAVMEMLTRAGHLAYFVGGCVRNALIEAPVSDIDISTNARPDTVIALAKSAGLNAIPTGYDHGTVTVISGGVAHEITTFRKDIETDGRRAVVAFSDNVADDARRRDFTMNALYADATGAVLDPLNGLPDLWARKVRFIENADQRIKEDYLRSLRFFRFHAWYGDPSTGLDAEGLAAIAQNLSGLEGLSKERVGSEMLKLLAAPDPAPAVGSMEQTGALAAILPGSSAHALAVLVHLELEIRTDAIRRLATLGGQDVGDYLRLSRQDAKKLDQLRAGMAGTKRIAEIGYRQGEAMAIDVALLRAAMLETPLETGYLEQARHGATQVFPVRADDLMPEYMGPALGVKLQELEARWIHSDFELTRSQLVG